MFSHFTCTTTHFNGFLVNSNCGFWRLLMEFCVKDIVWYDCVCVFFLCTARILSWKFLLLLVSFECFKLCKTFVSGWIFAFVWMHTANEKLHKKPHTLDLGLLYWKTGNSHWCISFFFVWHSHEITSVCRVEGAR